MILMFFKAQLFNCILEELEHERITGYEIWTTGKNVDRIALAIEKLLQNSNPLLKQVALA